MKYIITENRVEKLAFKYLDNMNFEIIRKEVDAPFGKIKNSEYYFTTDPSSNMSDITFAKWGSSLYLTAELCQELIDLFGFDADETELIIKDWVAKKLNKKIETWHVNIYHKHGFFEDYFKIDT